MSISPRTQLSTVPRLTVTVIFACYFYTIGVSAHPKHETYPNYLTLLADPEFYEGFYAKHYKGGVFGADFRKWLWMERDHQVATDLTSGRPPKQHSSLGTEPAKKKSERRDPAKAPAYGRSFGGFATEEERLEYIASRLLHPDGEERPPTPGVGSQPVMEGPHAVLFVHGWRFNAGSMAHLAFLYHEWGGVRPEIMFATTYFHGGDKLTFHEKDLIHIREMVEAVYDYMGKQKIDIVAYCMGVPLTLQALLGGEVAALEEGQSYNLGEPIWDKVRRFIGISGPVHGTRACLTDGGRRAIKADTAEKVNGLCGKRIGLIYGSIFLSQLARNWEAAAEEHKNKGFPMTFSIRAVPDELCGNLTRIHHTDSFVENTTILGQRGSHTVYLHGGVPAEHRGEGMFWNHRELRTHPNSVHFQFRCLGIPTTEVERHLVPRDAKRGELEELEDTAVCMGR